jgi:hypothetical protein
VPGAVAARHARAPRIRLVDAGSVGWRLWSMAIWRQLVEGDWSVKTVGDAVR